MSANDDLIKLYSARILELAAEIPHHARLPEPDATVKRRAPLCGSTVTVDVTCRNGRVADFGQEVKACALGQAAASVVGANIVGCDLEQVTAARDALRDMLKSDGPTPPAPFDGARGSAPGARLQEPPRLHHAHARGRDRGARDRPRGQHLRLNPTALPGSRPRKWIQKNRRAPGRAAAVSQGGFRAGTWPPVKSDEAGGSLGQSAMHPSWGQAMRAHSSGTSQAESLHLHHAGQVEPGHQRDHQRGGTERVGGEAPAGAGGGGSDLVEHGGHPCPVRRCVCCLFVLIF